MCVTSNSRVWSHGMSTGLVLCCLFHKAANSLARHFNSRKAEEMRITKQPEIRIIVLEKGEHLHTVIRRLEKGHFVRFHRGTSLLGEDVQVFTTLTGTKPLTWMAGTDHLATYCQVECTKAGSFKYHFNAGEMNCGSGYFLVMPTLMVNGRRLPLDGIACQTHLTKLLGPLSCWEDRLRVSKESGYNMIHLTPIHQLGVSNSSYSISDHHALIQNIKEEGQDVTFDDVGHIVNRIEKNWNMLTVQDVVWNHAAKNAHWLQEHPECGYNCLNSPHLRPAFVLDRAYHHFGKEVSNGKWASRGVPEVVNTVHHTNAIEYILRTEVLPKVRLHEFFQLNVEENVKKFEDLAKEGASSELLDEFLPIEQDPEWKRFGCSVNWSKAMKIFNRNSSEESIRFTSSRDFKPCSVTSAGKQSWQILMVGLRAVMGHIVYQRIAEKGPKLGAVTSKHPLTTDYFLFNESSTSWEEDEKWAYNSESSRFILAFNGWVMCSDPLKNFALADSQVYLRRELVCWGDSIKLNYGENPDDSPFLWQYMKSYTQECARLFHGLRIDNAHGTPIHVAEYLILAAREIRPDIYVFAELFTGSEEKDNLFVNRLGISSLIREAQAAHDSHEQGRLIYRYGGDVVGAMIQKPVRLAPSSVAHALFLDQSHDNPTPIETRSIYDILPTAAMISMASCAVGSTRGYDEIINHAIDVVKEKRLYAKWGSEVNSSCGIIEARRILNDLHYSLAKANYTQVFVDQMNYDIVGITRHNPVTHDTVVVISHTAFNKHQIHNGRVLVKQIPIGGVLEEILFEMRIIQETQEIIPERDDILLGLSNYKVHIRQHISPDKSDMCVIHGNEDPFIEITDFPSGSVIAFKIRLSKPSLTSIGMIRAIIEGNDELEREIAINLNSVSLQDYNRILFISDPEKIAINLNSVSLQDYNRILFISDPESCAEIGEGVYVVPRYGKIESIYDLNKIISSFFRAVLSLLDNVPYYLRPCYFEALITYIHKQCKMALLKKLPPAIFSSSALVRALALSSISFVGHVSNAKLAPLPSSIKLEDDHPSSIAAGLPHFAVGIWRNWGRDTFIALPGCLLSTGRFSDARNLIISYAGSLRHGLIPNLLAEGKDARYNCRDAVWFWLYSIERYVKQAPNGYEILSCPVRRIYPKDDTVFGEDEKIEPLINVMCEALERHFCGIDFRERHAGPQIDEHMTDEGFNVKIFVDRETGFIHGGNRWNCGTWMDKMGSSEKAGNRGEPATPRDGAAVEIQGLAYAVLSAMSGWVDAGYIQSTGVSQDFQLRCNFPIALTTAPSLLDPHNAWMALDMAKEHLLGPLGIKTLDPSDWAYNGYYNNDDDGYDKKTAKGWNYHQGPEWIWVAGFYLRARLAIGKALGGSHLEAAMNEVQSRLGNYYKHIKDSPWSSLPELTNSNGSYCPGSCPAQAWSVGCILEACLDFADLS
ncbi:glycogen debranching enzyme [Dictyocaulus viviparus]|uniref:Glycogen debranching enzyme n=1 Tax=Dictyocaulus viviparus TaxID=29172 RepID=A0A0D8Y173_DICVI|nr:glycogen debranching enzyme [Dictyocaulus viviparus]